MTRNVVWLAALWLLAAAIVPARPALALTETEVAEGLLCYACPGEPLTADRCRGGDQMRAAIRRMIAEGKTKQEILDYFVQEFGEEILTYPPKRGFNLVAYVGPFVGLLVGAAVAAVVVRRWSSAGRRRSEPRGSGSPPTRLDEKTRRRIEEELSHLDEEA
ncbi:MAG: hypothetical protein GXP50_04005 [Deltaproteobacteria bacterium]|nr:hypothetical protein [Deltaproteobacteria bacterium]